MHFEALSHSGNYPDVYAKDRKTLVFKLRVSREDMPDCSLIYCHSDRAMDLNEVRMQPYLWDDLYAYYKVTLCCSRVARYIKYFFKVQGCDKVQGCETIYFTAYGIQKDLPVRGRFEFTYASRTSTACIPTWCAGRVFYQIFPDRYCNGRVDNDPANSMEWGSTPTPENHMGGDIAGIISRLPYLLGMGIDCIYLNPIFTAKFNHKYASIDYYSIDPQFGTIDEFKELVEKTHELGMHIILDGVFNHVGVDFRPFRDVIEKGTDSEYWDWFHITEYPIELDSRHYECFGGYQDMPNLNTGNPEVREFILQVMDYWIREYHIDGWRLDVADNVDEGLWTEARYRLKALYPDVLLLGETWGSGRRLLCGNQLDSIMNYVFRDALLDYIAEEKISAEEFNSRIQRMLSDYPDETSRVLMLILDSHDTERFINACGGDKRKQKLGVTFQMLFVGAPSVYYGDEVGLDGNTDPDCRKCMIWEKEKQDEELLSFYQKLIQLRNSHVSIREGAYAVNYCRDSIYGFFRYSEDNERVRDIYCVTNASEETVEIVLPVRNSGEYKEYLGEEMFSAVGDQRNDGFGIIKDGFGAVIDLCLGPYEAKVLELVE